MPVLKQQAQISFLLYRTNDPNIVQQFKDFNDTINQNLNAPQANIKLIDNPNHPNEFQIAVIINQANQNQTKLINQIQTNMAPYQIKTFPDLDQLNAIDQLMTQDKQSNSLINAKQILIKNVVRNLLFLNRR